MLAQDLSSDVLITAAKDVFETMVFMDLQPLAEGKHRDDDNVVLGTITFNGSVQGCFGLHCVPEGAKAIAQSMLGMSPDEELSRADIQDAVGEVANMVMGNLKTLIADIFGDMQISVPTVIWGQHVGHDIGEDARKLYVGATLNGNHPIELSFLWRA